MLRAHAIGWRAQAALRASGGIARVTAPLSRSFYAHAASELIWVGGRDAALHPRAVLLGTVPAAARGADVDVVADHVGPWRPSDDPLIPSTRKAAARLRSALVANGPIRSLARLVVDDPADDAVTHHARPHVEALARACAAKDAPAFGEAARPLLGLGGGLTPSGDDVVGGALFARRILVGMDQAWEAAARAITTAAAHLTHPISARLLADLAAGEGWAPLHELIGALANDTGDPMVPLRRVLAIGHSSGWDLVAGMVIGLGASPRRA